MDIKLTKAEQSKIFSVAKGFATECEKKGIDEDTTKEMLVEVMRATAECLMEDRQKK
tara:strand:+ start:3061 stop:3231 length:171 start_codon:yes stop_codon:yes gene_type:complete